MENPQSLETAGYRCSPSADPFMITLSSPWRSREKKGRTDASEKRWFWRNPSRICSLLVRSPASCSTNCSP